MIRAKTLLASILLAGTAITVFALNTDHDGYAPIEQTHPGGAQQRVGTSLALQQPVVEPSTTIARLPKLAPTTSARTSTPHIPTPVVSQQTEHVLGAADGTTVKTGPVLARDTPRPVTTEASDPNAPPTTAVQNALADQSFARRKTPGTDKAPAQIGIPLPTRLPEENQLLRAKRLARVQQGPVAGSDDAYFDPAVPTITNRRTLRLKQLRQANRLRRNATRSAVKRRQHVPKSTQEAVTIAPKPVIVHRHREPFADTR